MNMSEKVWLSFMIYRYTGDTSYQSMGAFVYL